MAIALHIVKGCFVGELVRQPWTTAHGHFLQMGGFRLSATARENFFVYGEPSPAHRRETRSDIANSFLQEDRSPILIRRQEHYRHEISAGSWTFDYTFDGDLQSNSMDLIWEGVLSSNALKILLSRNLIRFPSITEDEINKMSKGDTLSKIIALLQLFWFILQIIARTAEGLAVTEIELATAATIGLNSIMYFFWWSKPRDLHLPVVIRTKGVEIMLAKTSETITESWSFSYEEFDLRKLIWISLTDTNARMTKSLGLFSLHFTRSARCILPGLVSIGMGSVCGLKRFLTSINRYFLRITERKDNGNVTDTNSIVNGSHRDVPYTKVSFNIITLPLQVDLVVSPF